MIVAEDLDLQESDHFLFFNLYLLSDMSKNHDRYKEDYSTIDIEQLEEIDTEKFEKFRPKNKKNIQGKSKDKSIKKDDE